MTTLHIVGCPGHTHVPWEPIFFTQESPPEKVPPNMKIKRGEPGNSWAPLRAPARRPNSSAENKTLAPPQIRNPNGAPQKNGDKQAGKSLEQKARSG